jgi:uncharacterized protein (TIRG00374 family)
MQKKPLSKANIIFYIFSVVLFGLAIRYLPEIRTAGKIFEKIDMRWIIAVVFIQVLTYIIVARIYAIILKKYEDVATVGFLDLLRLSIITVFINQAVPSGSLSGNGFLIDELAKRDIPAPKAAFAIFIEILTFYVAVILLLLGSVCIYISFHQQLPIIFLTVPLLGILFVTCLGTIVTLATKNKVLAYVSEKLAHIRFIHSYLKNIHFSLYRIFVEHQKEGIWKRLFENKANTCRVVALQLSVFLADAATIFFLFIGLHTPINFFIVSFGLVLTMTVAFLPISPGSLILYESSMTFFYSVLGVPLAVALVVTLLYRFLSFWLPMPIGLLLYRHLEKQESPNRALSTP